MPRDVTKVALNKTRGPVTAQTIDLTPNTPKVIDGAPYWSRDEQFIVFHSNRVDLNGSTAPPAGSPFHIYRMRPDGSNVTALTGPLSSLGAGVNNSQTEPAFNSGATSLVYIESTSGGAVDLVELNLSTNTARSILKNNPNGLSFIGLNGPTYGFAIGGNVGVIFAGRVQGGSFHLYTVDIQSGQVAQLTTGNFDDLNPTLSPDPQKPVVAFDRGPAGNQGAPRDIYVIGTNPNVQNATRVTNFSAGGRASSNIQPAWSTDKIDQPTGTQQIVRGQQLLGFASTRVDLANDGNANSVDAQGRHDIYWLKVTIALDPNNPSVYTVTTPESANNPAFKLSTNDPQHIYNDTHPTWPQFIATYRVAYQSDRTFYDPGTNNSGPAGQPTDIFASTLIDLNAPSLLRFDEITGDVLKIEPRISAPGSRVKFSAKLADFETGIRDVWVQVKNPNSKYQSADNIEHKVYAFRGASVIDNTNAVLSHPNEYDSQRIFIGSDPSDPRANSYANPSYISSISDFFAFSGNTRPPDAGWLQLNLESRDPVTGISTYSAFWTTDRFPTDYYVDLVVYDNAVNPFVGGGQSNWRIYDNVWGFTTQNFIPTNGILFVSDYSAGQKFFGARFGPSTLANVNYAFWGTESWLTDIDVALHPTQFINGTTIGPVFNFANTLGVKSFNATESYLDGSQDDGTRVDGFPVPPTQRYDMWRILCRGAVPDSVLMQYATRKDSQPPDVLSGETQPRIVTVADRAVFWNAPYAGSVFNGAGSITDLTTQTQLHNFLASGGRLFVNGQDVAWALTLGGAATNSFLSTDLKAQFVADAPTNPLSRTETFGAFIFWFFFSSSYQLTAAAAPNPITHDPWELAGFTVIANHCYPGPPIPPDCRHFIDAAPNYVVSGTPTYAATVGSLGVQYPDAVNATSGAVADLSYATGTAAVLHYQDNTTTQRVVYAPMGLEGLNSDAFVQNGTMFMKNRRAELVHNAVCWMRTGAVNGTVRDVEGGNPLEGVLVRLTHRANASGAPIWEYTGLTGPDGNYVINGLEAGAYEITAVKPGFTIQKRAPVVVHGGYRDNIGLRMTKAEPAVIKGTVTRTDGRTPVVGATVTATDILDSNVKFTAITDANGNYSIERVPSQTKYTLTVAANGFGESIPLSHLVEDPSDPTGQNLLQPAKVYGSHLAVTDPNFDPDGPYNFRLKAEPGSVTGFVFVKNANGSKGAPIANATVTATLGTQTVTAITDANGAYSFNQNNSPANGLDPGVWSIVAVAPGYAANNPAISVTVVTGQNAVAEDILLSTIPPGSVSGLVTRTSDGAPLTGVLVQLKDASGTVVASTTTVAVKTDSSGYRYNYVIANAPAGVTYTVTASRNGFTSNPASRTAEVKSNEETKNINFAMDPLHTFGAAVSLVSAPYDYAGFDLVNDASGQGGLLDVPLADAQNGTFKFATWDLGKYVYYPTPPANTFRLGRGYFLGYKQNLPLSIQGTPADTTRPFDIPLNAGWNMLGDPFTFAIDFTKVKFSIPGSASFSSYQQAVQQGWVGSVLYSYVSGSYLPSFRMDPWVGYWLRAYRNVIMRIDPSTDRAASRAAGVTAGTSRAILQGGSGWSVNLRVTVGETRDEESHFGVSSRAAEGFDGFKAEKPPVFGQRYTYLSFPHPEWGERAGQYGIDVRSATTGAKTWEFTVETSEAKATAVMAWPNVSALPRTTSLTLTDLATGQTRDMRTSSSFSWNTGDQPTTRKFRIEATPASRDTLKVTNVVARSTGRGPIGISFNLTQAANVDVRIVGVNGTQVRRVTGRASRAAGINEVTWDGKSDKNVAVPAGAYLVEIRAQSPDGKSTVRQVAPLTVVR